MADINEAVSEAEGKFEHAGRLKPESDDQGGEDPLKQIEELERLFRDVLPVGDDTSVIDKYLDDLREQYYQQLDKEHHHEQ